MQATKREEISGSGEPVFDLGKVLEPLTDFREKMLFIRGLFNAEALKGNIHSSQTGNLLSGAPLASGGDIRSVVKTMVTQTQFIAPANFGAKFKTPYRFVVSAARAAGMSPSSVQPLVAALEDLGQPLYGCLSPDGYGCTQVAWLDPSGLLRRTSFAMRMGAGEGMALTKGKRGITGFIVETNSPGWMSRSKSAIAVFS